MKLTCPFEQCLLLSIAVALIPHSMEAVQSKRWIDIPGEIPALLSFDSEEAPSETNIPLAGVHWQIVQTVQTQGFEQQQAAWFGVQKGPFVTVGRLDAEGLVARGENGQSQTQCGNSVVGSDTNIFTSTASWWLVKDFCNFEDPVALTAVGSPCGLSVCIGDTLFSPVGPVGGERDPVAENLRTVQGIDTTTGRLLETTHTVNMTCSDFVSNWMAVIGNKIVYNRCCSVNALDHTTGEMRVVWADPDSSRCASVCHTTLVRWATGGNRGLCFKPSGSINNPDLTKPLYAVTQGSDGWPVVTVPSYNSTTFPDGVGPVTCCWPDVSSSTDEVAYSVLDEFNIMQVSVVFGWDVKNPSTVHEVHALSDGKVTTLAAASSSVYMGATTDGTQGEPPVTVRLFHGSLGSQATQLGEYAPAGLAAGQECAMRELVVHEALGVAVCAVTVFTPQDLQLGRNPLADRIDIVAFDLSSGAATLLDTACDASQRDGAGCPDAANFLDAHTTYLAKLDAAVLQFKYVFADDTHSMSIHSIVDESSAANPFRWPRPACDGNGDPQDECSLGVDNCDEHATCSDTDASFECECAAGFVDRSGDNRGTSCDEDECATASDDCAAEASCVDTEGSFLCLCDASRSFFGDGVTCAAQTSPLATMALTVPMSLQAFMQELSNFKAALAALAGVGPADVFVSGVSPVTSARRRLTADGVRVDVAIQVAEDASQADLESRLSADAISAEWGQAVSVITSPSIVAVPQITQTPTPAASPASAGAPMSPLLAVVLLHLCSCLLAAP